MKRFAPLWVLLAGILWGSMGLFVKSLAALGLSSLSITAFRLTSGSFVMILSFLIFDRSKLKIRLRDLGWFVASAVFSVVAMSVLYFTSINATSMGVAAILLYTAPIFVMLMSCLLFKEKYPRANSYKVILYGSLAQTGKGHRTDYAIEQAFYPKKVEVEFDCITKDLPHPNTLRLFAYKKDQIIGECRVFSIGGGQIVIEGEALKENENVYPLHSFTEIAKYCRENNKELWQYVDECEDSGISEFIKEVWAAMKFSINKGLSDSGELPCILKVQKKAKYLYRQSHIDESEQTKENRLVCSYAFAVSEQNACGEKIVTAPTCGASGVLPAVLYYIQEKRSLPDEEIYKALKTASLIGNIVKTNASISGAECGCQAEVGTACAMASAALAQLYHMSLEQIEYAAEIAIEHHLGLTCDPIYGLVQIPCIERNAVAAMRAINAVNLANFLTDSRKISFDLVVQTMYETGKDLSHHYRETSEGGLAKLYK